MAETTNFNYKRYLASREWGVLREAVRQRAGGTCERCLGPMQAVHHMTYARIGHEDLDDLLAVCNACHAWLSGRTPFDPVRGVLAQAYGRLRIHLGSVMLFGHEDETLPWTIKVTCIAIGSLEAVLNQGVRLSDLLPSKAEGRT